MEPAPERTGARRNARLLRLGLVAVLAVLWLGSAGGEGLLSAPSGGIAFAAQEAREPVEAPPGVEEPDLHQEEGAPGEAPGREAARFFLILIAILVFAKGFGEAAERIGQPAVLGELIAGVVLGGSVLGIVPTTGDMGEIIHLLAEVGVAILLFEIGLETDLREMFRVGSSSAAVAGVGVFLPFLLGFLYWYLAEPVIGADPAGVTPTMVAIFVGATLTATSVGITARVLTDLNVMHRAESRIIIGAAVIDDVLGLVILAIVSGLAAGAAVTFFGVAWTFVVAVGFLVLAVVVGNRVAPRLFGLIDRMGVRGGLLVSAFSFALLFAALAAYAGSAMIIGAFAAGVVLSSTNQFDLIVERIEPVADLFTPIFFVSVGAAVDVGLFVPGAESFNSGVIVVGLILIAVAVVGKILAGFVVGWGERKLNRLAIGIGMVPRGEVGLIFADIGRRGGILSSEAFSAILIMVIVTTFLAPPLLKAVFRPKPGERPPSLPVGEGAGRGTPAARGPAGPGGTDR